MSCHYLSYRVPQDPKINKQKNYNMTAGATPGTQPNTRGRPSPTDIANPGPHTRSTPTTIAPRKPFSRRMAQFARPYPHRLTRILH